MEIIFSTSTITECVSKLSSLIEYAIGDFFAAVYEVDHLVPIGTALEIDESDNEVLTSFMESSVVFKSNSQTFCWPKKTDEIWLKNGSVMCLIPPPWETNWGCDVDDDLIQNIHRQCENVISGLNVDVSI